MKKLTLFACAILAMPLAADVAPAATPGEAFSGQCAIANGPSTLPVELDLWSRLTGFQFVQGGGPPCPVATSCVAPCTASSTCRVRNLGDCCHKPGGQLICCTDGGTIQVTTCPCEGPSCNGDQVTFGCVSP